MNGEATFPVVFPFDKGRSPFPPCKTAEGEPPNLPSQVRRILAFDDLVMPSTPLSEQGFVAALFFIVRRAPGALGFSAIPVRVHVLFPGLVTHAPSNKFLPSPYASHRSFKVFRQQYWRRADSLLGDFLPLPQPPLLKRLAYVRVFAVGRRASYLSVRPTMLDGVSSFAALLTLPLPRTV